MIDPETLAILIWFLIGVVVGFAVGSFAQTLQDGRR